MCRSHAFVVAALVAIAALIGVGTHQTVASAAPAWDDDDDRDADGGPFEVWMVDQKDTRPGSGGTLYIYDARGLRNDPAEARPEVVDLGGAVGELCYARTGTFPTRPHMLVFNGGDDERRRGRTHAILAFVVSGHVAFLDAESRQPVGCVDAGAQAHAAWPTPDQRFALVANQNGKLFQRIRTDYATNTFTLEPAATIDLANCTTPSGAPCQDPVLRPDNAPICPRTDLAGRFAFVTLRGGGMFVVDHAQTPMKIVAEYDRSVVGNNGCGLIEANRKMFVNSGGGTPSTPYAHILYAFDIGAFSSSPTPPNTPAPRVLYNRSAEGEVDAHGVALVQNGRYLWVGDRVKNDVTVVDTRSERVVNRFSLVGPASGDPAPDLLDPSPNGNRMFASLRGPEPASGGHGAIGATPGVGVIQVTEGGRNGRLVRVAPVAPVLSSPDPHAINVRPTGRGDSD